VNSARACLKGLNSAKAIDKIKKVIVEW